MAKKTNIINEKRIVSIGEVKNNTDFTTEWDNIIALEICTFTDTSLYNRFGATRECKGVKIHFANKSSKILKKVMTGKIADHAKVDRLYTYVENDGYVSEKFNVWNDADGISSNERTLNRAIAFFGTLTDDETGKYMFKIVSLAKLDKYQKLVDDKLISRDSTIQTAVRKQLETFSRFTDAEVDKLLAEVSIEK